MSFSGSYNLGSRTAPRIGQTAFSTTSLGAVGGARGVAAGALRIFVELLTTYDKQAMGELESDLNNLDHNQATYERHEAARQKRLHKLETDLVEIANIKKGKLNTQQRSELKALQALEGVATATRTKADKDQVTRSKTALVANLKAAKLSDNQINMLLSENKLIGEQEKIKKRVENAETRTAKRTRERVVVEGQVNRLQQIRASFAPRLAGLAIGAIGGVFGGALLGVGFAAAQVLLDKIGESIKDIVDPARHAREAMKELGEAVAKVASSENLSFFEAAKKYLDDIGLSADKAAVSVLAKSAADTQAAEAIKIYGQLVEIKLHQDALEKENLKTITDLLIKEARARGDVVKLDAYGPGRPTGTNQYFINGIKASTLAQQELNRILIQVNSNIIKNAQAKRIAAQAAGIAAIQEEKYADAIAAAGQRAIGAIDIRIEALPQDSARTKALQEAIERASGGGSSNAGALRNLADERQLILLRQRLRLLGTAINLEKYSGKFLLEAINAKIAALQKEGDEQEKLNRLQDLQYRMTQEVRRNQGESVIDFLERRAQEQRSQLQEQAAIERDEQIAQLETRRQTVQDQVDLAENAEQRLELLRQQGTADHLKNLQKQLEASQEKDKKEYESRKKALEKEKKALEEAVQETIKLSKEEEYQKMLALIQGATTLSEFEILSGKLAGYRRARAAIEAFAESFGMPKDVTNALLYRINSLISTYNLRFESLFNRAINRYGGRQSFASGGVIPLTNASSPFGQNVKLGEQGTELGIILSNKVTQALRNMTRGPEQVGPFYLYGSDNLLRDKYMLRKTVTEAMEESLS